MINNIIPEVKISLCSNKHIKKDIIRILSNCLNLEGFQLFSFKNDALIGVLEGPPKTPYENGYFLFKILLSKDFPLRPPQFIFFSPIFHPNISENGFVSVNILQEKWSPAILIFDKIIYSIQSLLDDPNPDNFLNEIAANFYKKDRKIYDETVREYTSRFANYKIFLEDIKNMNIEINTIKEGEKINKKEILGLNYISKKF